MPVGAALSGIVSAGPPGRSHLTFNNYQIKVIVIFCLISLLVHRTSFRALRRRLIRQENEGDDGGRAMEECRDDNHHDQRK